MTRSMRVASASPAAGRSATETSGACQDNAGVLGRQAPVQVGREDVRPVRWIRSVDRVQVFEEAFNSCRLSPFRSMELRVSSAARNKCGILHLRTFNENSNGIFQANVRA